MKKTIAVLIGISLLMTGCINIYTRCPRTNSQIETSYQCTVQSASFSYVIMFPQTLQIFHSNELCLGNALSIPAGCLCYVDVACEAIIDTICWPIDYAIAKHRKAVHSEMCKEIECALHTLKVKPKIYENANLGDAIIDLVNEANEMLNENRLLSVGLCISNLSMEDIEEIEDNCHSISVPECTIWQAIEFVANEFKCIAEFDTNVGEIHIKKQ